MGDGKAEHSNWEILYIFGNLASFIVTLKSCAAREIGATLAPDVAGGLQCWPEKRGGGALFITGPCLLELTMAGRERQKIPETADVVQ